jgi:hypothetical protein
MPRRRLHPRRNAPASWRSLRNGRAKPIVAWHATDRVFDRFDPDRSGLGTHFGTYRAAAGRKRQIGKFRGPAGEWRVTKYALRFASALRTDDIGGWDDEPQVEAMLLRYGVIRATDLHDSRRLSGAAFWSWARRRLADAGYDAIAYENRVEDKGRDSYVVWNNGIIDPVDR